MIAGTKCIFFQVSLDFWGSRGERYTWRMDIQIGAVAPHGGRKLSLRSRVSIDYSQQETRLELSWTIIGCVRDGEVENGMVLSDRALPSSCRWSLRHDV